MAIILGIESSCDDTSAAIIKDGIILSNFIAGQKVHEEFGGVVPELASRAHQQNIIPVVDTAIKNAGISKNDIDGIEFVDLVENKGIKREDIEFTITPVFHDDNYHTKYICSYADKDRTKYEYKA